MNQNKKLMNQNQCYSEKQQNISAQKQYKVQVMNLNNPGLLSQIKFIKSKELHPIETQKNKVKDIKCYYNQIFSPQDAAKSIRQRNQALQIAQFDKTQAKRSDQEIYERRLKKVEVLQKKQSEQINILEQLRIQNNGKFQAIYDLLAFISELKNEIKVDYYSNKTFSALKSSSENDIRNLKKILHKMHYQLKKQLKQNPMEDENEQEKYIAMLKQFLIIPRFLISKEKIQQFVKSDDIQQNFQFLVSRMCLGHQNNQANKKFPENDLIKQLRILLDKDNGKQIFKTICSINHGNKFRLKNGKVAYNYLFTQNLQTLKQLDRRCKKKGTDGGIGRKSSLISTLSNPESSEQKNSGNKRIQHQLLGTGQIKNEQIMINGIFSSKKSIQEERQQQATSNPHDQNKKVDHDGPLLFYTHKIVENIIIVSPPSVSIQSQIFGKLKLQMEPLCE